VPIHFHSSVISGSASRISARMRARVSPRHPPRSRIRWSMSREAGFPVARSRLLIPARTAPSMGSVPLCLSEPRSPRGISRIAHVSNVRYGLVMSNSARRATPTSPSYRITRGGQVHGRCRGSLSTTAARVSHGRLLEALVRRLSTSSPLRSPTVRWRRRCGSQGDRLVSFDAGTECRAPYSRFERAAARASVSSSPACSRRRR